MQRILPRILWASLFLWTSTAIASVHAPFSAQEISVLQHHLLENIATADHVFHKKSDGGVMASEPGVVLAAAPLPISHFSQDYTFHWMRDAALSMQVILQLAKEASPQDKPAYEILLKNYVAFESRAQHQPSKPGEDTLGQPKFNIDGTVWDEHWGRPQNDGPALRAMTLMQIQAYFASKAGNHVSEGVPLVAIKNDLDYVCETLNAPTYDLWEEVQDTDHFYTRMVQRKSLLLGADFMRSFHSNEAAKQYAETATTLTNQLIAHWNESLGAYTETLDQLNQKGGGLDSSVLLGVLHGQPGLDDDEPLSLADPKVMSTVAHLRLAFAALYPINASHLHAPLMGRYPTDIYDGDQFVHGNPWVLITNALAEYDYRLAAFYLRHGNIDVTATNRIFFEALMGRKHWRAQVVKSSSSEFRELVDALVAEGDQLLLTVKKYQQTYPDGSTLHFSEQIDRERGVPVSAPDLSWGYASFLTALHAREAALGRL